MLKLLNDWLSSRLPVQPIVDFFAKKNVPTHRHSFWYAFGGMALTMLTIQMVSGILLLFYYTPSPDGAYESIHTIMNDVPFGWLIRSIHAYGANLMIAILFVHMFSVMFMKGYRKPRELTWFTGFILFGAFLTFGFSGYLLPWNELSFFATKVGTEIAGTVPFVGHFLMEAMRGGTSVGDITLSRFFALHVGILPYVAMGVLGLHLAFIQAQGVSSPPQIEAEAKKAGRKIPAIRFFPDYLLHDAINGIILILVLVLLSVVAEAGIGKKADPLAAAPQGIEPEWYFLFMFQTLRKLPAYILFFEGRVLGVLAFGLGGLYLFLLPLLDRKSPDGKHRKIFTYIGIIIVVFIVVMTLYAWGQRLLEATGGH
jgi:cytochrome b6